MKPISGENWRVGCHADEPVTGPVAIVTSATDLYKVKKGDVMVANQTDVNYTPQMLDSVAIITAEGGRYSHAATFSRENNLPCIIGASGIMDELCDGQIVSVDTHAKTVTILDNN